MVDILRVAMPLIPPRCFFFYLADPYIFVRYLWKHPVLRAPVPGLHHPSHVLNSSADKCPTQASHHLGDRGVRCRISSEKVSLNTVCCTFAFPHRVWRFPVFLTGGALLGNPVPGGGDLRGGSSQQEEVVFGGEALTGNPLACPFPLQLVPKMAQVLRLRKKERSCFTPVRTRFDFLGASCVCEGFVHKSDTVWRYGQADTCRSRDSFPRA